MDRVCSAEAAHAGDPCVVLMVELLQRSAAGEPDLLGGPPPDPLLRVLGKELCGLGGSVVEVHCACSAEVAVARYNARSRHEVHTVKEVTLAWMERYDRPVGIGSLITVDTTAPVDVAAVAAEVRRLRGRAGPRR